MPASIRHALPQLATSAALAAVLLTSACSVAPNEPPKFCPSLGLLDNGTELTRFQGAGRDITDITLTGRIDSVPAKCSSDGDAGVVATLTVQSTLNRGTAARGRDAQIAYLITVLNGDTIVQQRDYPLQITFPDHVDRAAFATAPISLKLAAPASGSPNYRVFVSFKLTPDELAYNRSHPSR